MGDKNGLGSPRLSTHLLCVAFERWSDDDGPDMCVCVTKCEHKERKSQQFIAQPVIFHFSVFSVSRTRHFRKSFSSFFLYTYISKRC